MTRRGLFRTPILLMAALAAAACSLGPSPDIPSVLDPDKGDGSFTPGDGQVVGGDDLAGGESLAGAGPGGGGGLGGEPNTAGSPSGGNGNPPVPTGHP